MAIKAIICDYGGVLTTPLYDSFLAYEKETGVSPMSWADAMEAGRAELDGEHPLFELECGRISEPEFLELTARYLHPIDGAQPDITGFSARFFANLSPNQPMIELMAELRASGYRMGMLTNNVKEWGPLWRPFLPVDEIFEFVIDSAYEGMRKPDPRIYLTTVAAFGDGIEPSDCLFVDDMEPNCDAARELGIRPVQFQTNEQALAEIESALNDG